MSDSSPNSIAWKKLFDKFPIEKEVGVSGIYRLTAKQVNKVGQREARLMTKFDSRTRRPKLLLENHITILPITNGEYVLLKGDGYFDVPTPQKVETYSASRLAEMQTLPWRSGIRGESQAIDLMFMASILRTFVGDPELQLTLRGRLGSRKFSFYFKTEIRRETITVDGVTIEIDSGFEGNSVVLLEAKFGTIDSFIIRQLYYPLRDLMAANVTKKITPVLLVYSNKVFSLYSFAFRDLESYHSIELVRQSHYSLDEHKPLPTIGDLLTGKRRRAPDGVPFPQADDISKVFDVTEVLTAGPANKEQIAERFDVDPRQGDYYGNAAIWLGLAEKAHTNFQLSKEGSAFALMNRSDRIAWLSQRLCEMPVFREAAEAFVHRAPMDDQEITRIIARTARLSGSTLPRRAITVRAWVNWMAQALKLN
jgi:hypothetical protein